MAKKNFTYSIEKEVEKELDYYANNVAYRSKSSIVQEAIQQYLKDKGE